MTQETRVEIVEDDVAGSTATPYQLREHQCQEVGPFPYLGPDRYAPPPHVSNTPSCLIR